MKASPSLGVAVDIFWVWFVFLGIAVGLLVGLTGLGGGVLMTPLLIFSGLSAIVAIGTDIIYSAISKIFASLLHIREKNVEYKIVAILLAGSIPGVIVGYFFSLTILNNFGESGLNLILTATLSIILISLSLISIINEVVEIIRRNIFDVPDEVVEEFDNLEEQSVEEFMEQIFLNKQVFGLIMGAFMVGVLVQLTSIGAGVLVTILLLNVLPPRRVVGTELVHASILVSISSVLYLNLGFVNYDVLWKIVLGSLIGITIGIRFSKKVPKRQLRLILLGVIFFAGISVLLSGVI